MAKILNHIFFRQHHDFISILIHVVFKTILVVTELDVAASVTSFQHFPVLSYRVSFSNAAASVVCFGILAAGCVVVADALTWGPFTV